MSLRLAVALVLVPGLTAGCDVVPRGPVDLRDARIVSVQIGARAGHQTFCPGEPVPLDLDVTAMLPGKAAPTRLHVHREDLDDWLVDVRAFHMSSRQGKVDEDAVFHPKADARASAETGFLLDLHLPDGPAFGVRFRPTYECVHAVGVLARAGREGATGEPGLSGFGVDAQPGDIGGAGGAGAAGATQTLYVTLVKTPFYPRLIAAIAEGDADDLVLAPASRSLLVTARGGAGGEGGEGGEGGHAFSTEDINPPRRDKGRRRGSSWIKPAGRPGDGGPGGPGGPGGAGGHLVVHIDSRFPELAGSLEIDVRGGPGGLGGMPGRAGDASPIYGYARRRDDQGRPTRPGTHGATGPIGVDGTRRVLLDDAAVRRFAGLGGIEVL